MVAVFKWGKCCWHKRDTCRADIGEPSELLSAACCDTHGGYLLVVPAFWPHCVLGCKEVGSITRDTLHSSVRLVAEFVQCIAAR
jgi:hypothetical protein